MEEELKISKSRGGRVNTIISTKSKVFVADKISTMILWGNYLWNHKASISITIFFIKTTR